MATISLFTDIMTACQVAMYGYACLWCTCTCMEFDYSTKVYISNCYVKNYNCSEQKPTMKLDLTEHFNIS